MSCLGSAITAQILLHHYIFPSPYPGPASQAVNCSITFLVRMGLLRDRDSYNEKDSPYELTEKGRVLVYAILELPLPIATWEMPK